MFLPLSFSSDLPLHSEEGEGDSKGEEEEEGEGERGVFSTKMRRVEVDSPVVPGLSPLASKHSATQNSQNTPPKKTCYMTSL